LSQLRRQRPVASSIASSSSPSFVVAEPASCTPTDRPESNQAYYENEYVQGFTINLPSDAALSEMKRSNFANTDKCFSYYISVLLQLSLKPGSRGAVAGGRTQWWVCRSAHAAMWAPAKSGVRVRMLPNDNGTLERWQSPRWEVQKRNPHERRPRALE
jgi:hypothetical protein